ncbi:MAG: DPP IV N-terminal domain-containing protein [Rikenellaceae bacterium]|nr:DPP IV N-terminal domain-containing protein [Rikenellaceae bacterium]
MKANLKRLALAVLLTLVHLGAGAQFYSVGDDRFSRWYSIESENYKVIYPLGLDSLAREYARELERFRRPVGLTSGYLPGEKIRGRMPVVLHPHNAVSNGSVAWAPKRMDAFTIPQIYGSEAHPWITQLAVHESRHISQMQFGLDSTQGVIGWFLGEMWNGLTAAIYTESSFLEGDAVIAETELTRSGRGRKADFLNYYMVSFDQGDLRDWDQWRFGSQKKYTPDWYALGYLTYGGMRWLYDRDDYTDEYLHYAAKHFFRFDVRDVIAKHTTGKDLVHSFPAIRDSVTAVWQKDAEVRKPYMPMEQITAEPRKTADYENFTIIGSSLFSIKHGFNDNYKLVCIDLSGQFADTLGPARQFPEKFISYFNGNSGQLYPSPDGKQLYWSEAIPDARWTVRYTSDLRYSKPFSKSKKTLRHGNWDYNPVPSRDGKRIAAVGVKPEGGSMLNILDSENGALMQCLDAPDSLQLVDLAWMGENVVCATAISENGFGIYCTELENGNWKVLLRPTPVQMKDLQSDGDRLLFTSDRTGVNELYSFRPGDGSIRQLTSTRYGASDYVFDKDRNYLYYASMTRKGKMIYRTAAEHLFNKEVDWDERYSWPIADKLSEQARRRAEKIYSDKDFIASESARADTMQLSEPKRYRKFPQMFRVHSWAPVYVNLPALMNGDLGDNIFDNIKLGATAVIQNQLGTFSGIAGYSVHPDPYDKKHWRNGLHLNLKYSGLYPVFEFNLDFNDRGAKQGQVSAYELQPGRFGVSYSELRDQSVPYITGSLSAYIPFRFSSGGWSRGLTPRISYSLSNDWRDANAYIFRPHSIKTSTEEVIFPEIQDGSKIYHFSGKQSSLKNLPAQNLRASLSYYSLLPTTNSAIYPRWGGGVQAGVNIPLGMTHWFSPSAFAYGYAYLPGVVPEQGLKLKGMWQGKIPSIEKKALYDSAPFRTTVVDILPRGLQDATLRSVLTNKTDNLYKLSADYSIPIYVGDRSLLASCIYIRRLQFIPHIDLTLFNKADIPNNKLSGPGCLMTYGFDLAVDLQCILWLLIPCSIGISVNFNGAPGWNGLANVGNQLGVSNIPKFYIGPVFSFDMF